MLAGEDLASLRDYDWPIAAVEDVDARVIVRALAGEVALLSWHGYAPWDGELPVAFIGEVRDNDISWDEGGAPGPVRLGVATDGSGGSALAAWMPPNAATITVVVLPGAPALASAMCRVREARELGPLPPVRYAGPPVPAQLRSVLPPGSREEVDALIDKLDDGRDMEQLLAAIDIVAWSGWLPAMQELMDGPRVRTPSRRIVTAAMIVQSVHCGPISPSVLTAIGRNIAMLGRGDSAALLAYAARAFGIEDDAKGLMAMMAGPMEPEVEAAIVGSVRGERARGADRAAGQAAVPAVRRQRGAQGHSGVLPYYALR